MLDFITVPSLTSAARTAAGYLAVWLVAKGFIVEGESEFVVTSVVTFVGLAASVYFRRRQALINQVAALPETKEIVTTPELAANAPSAKVTA